MCDEWVNEYIKHLAKKIANIYPNSCADKDDYIQEGHLKLLEIMSGSLSPRNFQAYAIVSIARAMRDSAIKAACNVHASRKIRQLICQMKKLLLVGYTEKEVCEKLDIDNNKFRQLQQLVMVKPFDESIHEYSLNTEI